MDCQLCSAPSARYRGYWQTVADPDFADVGVVLPSGQVVQWLCDVCDELVADESNGAQHREGWY